MKKIYRWLFLLGFLTAACPELMATHNRAGEITYEQVGPLTIRVKIVTYTKGSSPVDRDSLIVSWGDGTSEIVGRSNTGGTALGNDIKQNFYVKEHTYPGRGTYTIGMTDPNRIAEILNIDYPNSVRVKFHLTTTFTFVSQQFQGENNSAVLLQPPIDVGCVGRPFVHNPNAYDPDGDSLAYEWGVPLQDVGSPVPNYIFPDQIEPGPENQITLDEKTGDIVWDSPQRRGQYNMAIRIKEYRNGVLINTITRDMQVHIQECDNHPPSIEVASALCAEAGELLEIPIAIDDPERATQKVSLTASGGSFDLEVSPSVLAGEQGFADVPRNADFIWQTHCDHVRPSDYNVVFKAMDNFFSDSLGLVDMKSLSIKVVGPAPPRPEIDRDGDQVHLQWSDDYSCRQSDNFLGYTIWRSNGSVTVPEDTCLTDLNAYGYSIVGFTDREERTHFTDETVQNGVTYCYRLTARFGKVSSAGNPYNIVESKPSEEICIQIDRDLPLVTGVSVAETGESGGEMEVSWMKPEIDVDSLSPDGPYTMTLYHSTELEGEFIPLSGSAKQASAIAEFDEEYVFFHQNLNTAQEKHYYKVLLESSSREIGFSSIASGIFLSATEGNNRIGLRWESLTPWKNINYIVFRKEGEEFVEIGQTSGTQFGDTKVENEKEYCYRIEGEGVFQGISVTDTTYNFSQEVCAVPDDRIPPCRPELTVENNCEEGEKLLVFTNTLSVTIPDSCLSRVEDVEILVEYRPFSESEFEDITGSPALSFIHEQLINHSSSEGFAGCYRVRLKDQSEGYYSDTVCVDPCPLYKLPNVFTPNWDGHNDVYYPLNQAFIQKVNFEVYNRWGNLVFRTNDPDINWDGKDMNGNDVEAATYTYKCELFVDTRSGQILYNTLSGTIEVVR